ncbi:MAG TPA: dihydrofolate reductase family protein [Chitinophaga sp.]|uniref:dihydrofolate reductase family protein n=1 Tax=Chitinophaga sp. TaxID=1869181 RepID=UPI002CE77E4F|nr:dihydrofolate reductase family protein [Chitinophaga sp.]HVI46395.1 dihydrofolate reductase family protein [Chitinophaga sp.]
MRKLSLFMHTTLDGFVAGPNGEMDWIKVDDEMFEYAGMRTSNADTALYGRVTYQMMDAYWPTAADQPSASKHDIEHSNWYNSVHKVVLSQSMRGEEPENTTIVSDDIAAKISELKQQPGKEILIFGSPTASHILSQAGLIDEYWLFVNPIVLGNGIPLFKGITSPVQLRLQKSVPFKTGVVGLFYERENV